MDDRRKRSPSRDLEWHKRPSVEIEAEIERLAFLPRREITVDEALLHAALLQILDDRKARREAGDFEAMSAVELLEALLEGPNPARKR